jgi:hypothetical protein
MHMQISSWGMSSWMVCSYRRFCWTCFSNQSLALFLDPQILKNEEGYSETSVTIYQVIRRYIVEDTELLSILIHVTHTSILRMVFF